MGLPDLVAALRRRWLTGLVAAVVLTLLGLLAGRLLGPVSDGPTSTRLELVASRASVAEAQQAAQLIGSQTYAWAAVAQREEVAREAVARSGAPIATGEALRRLVVSTPQPHLLLLGLPGVRASVAVPLLDAWAQVACEHIDDAVPEGDSGEPLVHCTQAVAAAPTPSAASRATRDLSLPLSIVLGVLGGLVAALAHDAWQRPTAAAAAVAVPASSGVRGVGVDVEDVVRWREPRRLADLFTPAELERAGRYADPAPHYAGWWAAREAAVKALAAHGVTLRQVSVAHDDEGRPHVVVDGRPGLGEGLELSISHSDDTAVAVVVRR